jgi:hypothetical protein
MEKRFPILNKSYGLLSKMIGYAFMTYRYSCVLTLDRRRPSAIRKPTAAVKRAPGVGAAPRLAHQIGSTSNYALGS